MQTIFSIPITYLFTLMRSVSIHRDHCRCHLDAIMCHREKLAIEAVAAGTYFITNIQPWPICRELLEQFAAIIPFISGLDHGI